MLQACAFRDSYEKFKKAGAEVVGISGDDPSSHKASSTSPYKQLMFSPFLNVNNQSNKELFDLHLYIQVENYVKHAPVDTKYLSWNVLAAVKR